jgi:deoxycytidine triphosphate deaminase
MTLSDSAIRTQVRFCGLGIFGPDGARVDLAGDRLQPASVELCLGAVAGHRWDDGPFLLTAGGFTLASTAERVTIPPHLYAHLDGKSTLGRLGLVVHVTAGWIDPGFDGEITLELANLSAIPVRLVEGMRIAQLRFGLMEGRVVRPYGHPGLGSHYQGQTGPTGPAS